MIDLIADLALASPATNVVSEFAAYPRQSADVSHGRVRGESGLHGALLRPTPGKANASSGPGFTPEVAFSRKSTSFTSPFTLELVSLMEDYSSSIINVP